MDAKFIKITKTSVLNETPISLPFEIELQIGKQWLQLLKDWSSLDQMCGRCGQHYKEIENIGSWRCKQHAREWNSFTNGTFYGANAWDCCGSKFHENNSEYARACVPSDHNRLDFGYEKPENDVVIPRVFLKYLVHMRPEALLDEERLADYMAITNEILPSEYVVVRRYNENEQMSREARGQSAVGQTKVNGTWIEKRHFSRFGIQ